MTGILAARLAETLADVVRAAPHAVVEFVVHNPVGCCGDPHPHDVPDLLPEVVEVDARGSVVVVRLSELYP